MKKFTFFILAVIGALMPLSAAQSGDSLFADTGIRLGVDAESEVNIVSYELFGTIGTDWSWQSNRIRLDLGIETAIGGLSGEGETAVYGRIAPVAAIYFSDSPVSLVMSSEPSLYSEDRFDQYDIGGNFQFTSSVGFNWEFDDAWAVGYRFQHTSNADIDDPNSGLDMHTVSIAYTF